jgi:hypothetical protein
VFCIYCNKECKSNNSKAQHEIRCPKNSNRKISKSSGKYNQRLIPKTKCKYCINEYIDSSGLKNHERRCPNNPDRNLNLISADGKQNISDSNRKRIWTKERRENHSKSMKKAVEENPEAYSSSNRGRTKQIIYEGLKFQGNWEVEFYKWCKTQNIVCDRLPGHFEYDWNGKRKYFPDFYIPSLDLYVEVKGYATERDHAKWDQFPKRLAVISKDQIYLMKENKSLNLLDLEKKITWKI